MNVAWCLRCCICGLVSNLFNIINAWIWIWSRTRSECWYVFAAFATCASEWAGITSCCSSFRGGFKQEVKDIAYILQYICAWCFPYSVQRSVEISKAPPCTKANVWYYGVKASEWVILKSCSEEHSFSSYILIFYIIHHKHEGEAEDDKSFSCHN